MCTKASRNGGQTIPVSPCKNLLVANVHILIHVPAWARVCAHLCVQGCVCVCVRGHAQFEWAGVHVCAGVHMSVCACVHVHGLGGQACAGLCCSPPFPGGEFGLVPLFQVDGIDSGGVKDQS